MGQTSRAPENFRFTFAESFLLTDSISVSSNVSQLCANQSSNLSVEMSTNFVETNLLIHFKRFILSSFRKQTFSLAELMSSFHNIQVGVFKVLLVKG